jgi:hypothetical protein
MDESGGSLLKESLIFAVNPVSRKLGVADAAQYMST